MGSNLFRKFLLFQVFSSLTLCFICLYADDLEYLPIGGNGQIIHHDGFSLQYSEAKKQPLWVAYHLSKQEVITKAIKRTDNFRPDPSITTGSATLADYKGSGFDRGHMVSASDLDHSIDGMNDSFYLSNMSPQVPSFNRGIWKKLEEQVRSWAVRNDAVYVVTGTLFLEDKGAIGVSHVDIPSHYYKIIFDGTEPELKAIALILPNEGSKKPLQTFAVTIDHIENLSGLDFLAQLPDDLENDLEDDLKPESWSWSSASYQTIQVDGGGGEEVKGEGEYWISSSSGVRHNSSCRYYQKSKGKRGGKSEGSRACKVCGG